MHPEGANISVVVPVRNERQIIGETLRTVAQVLEGCAESWEIVVVDDGSSDGTFDEVERAHRDDPRVKGVKLSRHFGKEAALLAGLVKISGNAVVTMDGDLQHPPELIPLMLEQWRQGAQIVHGVKRSREYGGFLHRKAALAFNRIFSWLVGFNIVNSSDFKLFDAEVARLLVERFPEHERFHRGLSTWVGFRQHYIEFDVADRRQGESRWSLIALLRYGWRTLTAYTSLPLQLVPALGALMLLISALLGVEALVSRFRGNAISGFATLEITLLFIGSMIMIGLGVIGQYLARIYDEIKKRPVYLVQKELGF